MPATRPPTPRTDPRGVLAAVLRAVADDTVELEFGFACRSPSLPLWRDANTLHVTAGAPPPAPVLIAAARRLGCVQLAVYDEQASRALLPDMEAGGIETLRFLLMAHAGERPPVDARVERCDGPQLTGLYADWLRTEPELAARPEVIAQGAEAQRRLTSRLPARAFCVRDERGAPIGMALALGEGPTMMVEDVYVDASRRGAGLGGALVRTATAAAFDAGAATVFLATSTEGLAQRLYRRLGFEPAGIVHRFVLGEA